VAAHPVAHYEDAVTDEDAVLVAVATSTDIGAAAELNHPSRPSCRIAYRGDPRKTATAPRT
jgi:hypothetical protein